MNENKPKQRDPTKSQLERTILRSTISHLELKELIEREHGWQNHQRKQIHRPTWLRWKCSCDATIVAWGQRANRWGSSSRNTSLNRGLLKMERRKDAWVVRSRKMNHGRQWMVQREARTHMFEILTPMEAQGNNWRLINSAVAVWIGSEYKEKK